MPPIELPLGHAVEFIENDELVEITPKIAIRLRKYFLKEHERHKARHEGAQVGSALTVTRYLVKNQCLQQDFFDKLPRITLFQ